MKFITKEKFFIIFFLIISVVKVQNQYVNAQTNFFDYILTFFGLTRPPNEQLPQDTVTFKDEYDFIVIGAGSGGSTVAGRLSENPNWDVLILEAGGDESFFTDVPIGAAFLEVTSYNWGYKTEPSPNFCTGLVKGRCNWPRGKGLGGTSIINFLLYSRGNRRDFDNWANLGNSGWSYNEILPYFKKSEDVRIPELANSPYRSTGGPLTIEESDFRTPLVHSFVGAAKYLGYNITDPNGEKQTGFSFAQGTIRRGQRCSASKAFLRPARNRPNLHIAKEARVLKILIDTETKIAYGVEFVKNRIRYVVRAKKEVILAAGTLNSPQLLMLSGIGPEEHLKQLRIPVIQNLKVGYNLQDHVSLSGLVFLVNQPVTITDRRLTNLRNIIDYMRFGKGPFTLPGGAEGIAFLTTKYAEHPEYPDVELVMSSGSLAGDTNGVLRRLLGISDEFVNKLYGSIFDKDVFSIVPVLMRAWSRGRVMLKSTNPFQWPLFYPNYLSDERDVKVLTEGVKLAIKAGTAPSFQKFNSTFHTVPYPGCEHLEFGSDPYWECCIRSVTVSLYHQAGTCKMGPASDPDAVVDPELRVYGVKGLRVVDASIMPVLPAGHPNAVVFMIGEKASDMIKATWKGID